jgi:hypothetical protein
MPIREGASSVHEQTAGEQILSLDPPVYVVAPSPAMLVEATTATFQDPPVTASVDTPLRIVTTPEQMTALSETFRAGHQAAELAAQRVVGFRTKASLPVDSPVIVGPGHVSTVVSFGQSYGLFDSVHAGVESLARERATAVWDEATAATVDRPAWRTVTVDLEDRTCPRTRQTFVGLLDARRDAPCDRTLDVPTLAVLAGAVTGALQKAIADWCQSQSVAAASTVSTRKSVLCERGLVAVRPDPQDSVGAPVHRLTLADEHLDGLSPAELYDVVVDVVPERLTS